jgi:formiminoglutamate deiminase
MKLWCRHAWLGGPELATGVLLEVAGERIAAVAAGVAPPADAERLDGLVLPGLANAHSHAFQRALRGATHRDLGSFWTWRRQMYQLAGRLEPDSMLAVARAAFAEMALAGITLVGEFHYVHHGPGGEPYSDPNAMGRAVVEAAGQAGVRLTLLDACYLDGGIEPDPVQERFFDADVEAWMTRVTALDEGPAVRIGAAVHSMRAVPPESAAQVVRWAGAENRPIHAHVSEQPAENEACQEVYGATPTGLLHFEGALSNTFTAVHATHLTDTDVSLLGQAGVSCCLCPTTERDLADGIGPARRLSKSGCRLTIGTDSNALIDPWEEMRAIELNERLASGSRGGLDGPTLLQSGTASGYQSLGWPAGGRIAEGALADLVCLSLTGVRLAGCSAEDLIDAAVFAAAPGDVRHVIVGGRFVVRDGRHVSLDVAGQLDSAVGALRR